MAKQQSKNEEESLTPVTIYLEQSLVNQMDEEAKQTRRSRSQMGATLIEDALASRRARVHADATASK